MSTNTTEIPVKTEVQTIAVAMYVEPLSGKSFKTEKQALKHGEKMRKEQAAKRLQAKKRKLWRNVKDKTSFLDAVKTAVELQVEEWELRFVRKKGCDRPEWKGGEIDSCELLMDGHLKLKLKFEVWRDEQPYKEVRAHMGEFDLLGSWKYSSSSWGESGELGFWRVICDGVAHSSAKPFRYFVSYELNVELPVKRYPGLLASLQADVALIKAESDRRLQVHKDLVAAIQADAAVVGARQALKAAEEEVQRLKRLCAECEEQVEEAVYARESVREAARRWDETVGGLLSLGQLNELVESAEAPRLFDLFLKDAKVACKP